MASQNSFNEVLDYLLNRHEERYNVLNFEVDRFGTDQSYLYYRDFATRQEYGFSFICFLQ